MATYTENSGLRFVVVHPSDFWLAPEGKEATVVRDFWRNGEGWLKLRNDDGTEFESPSVFWDLAPHDCSENAVPYQDEEGALGHGFECGICQKLLQVG